MSESNNAKLVSLRLYRHWEQDYVATELSITLEEYRSIESGQDRVDAETALKLSELFRVPPQFFLANDSSSHLSVIYTHCHFENSNGYVNHLYQNNGELFAKEEVKRLQKQNDELIQSLLNKS